MSEMDPVNRCDRCDSYRLTKRTGNALLAAHNKLLRVIEVQKDGLKRGCSCRPGGGTCPACLALAESEKIMKE